MAATAELALAGFSGLEENTAMTPEALMRREDNDFADAIAAGVDMIVIGLTKPFVSVVPVMVEVVGPPDPSSVIVVVISGGIVNREEGNGL